MADQTPRRAGRPYSPVPMRQQSHDRGADHRRDHWNQNGATVSDSRSLPALW
ncbi:MULTISPECIES: hypothetical protein [Pacificibacter]|uniref:hypothetical protein n=1 Tax=Pacificibacter TaxID=1042323 RepID=UPI001C0848E9|nr:MULTISPECIES: hypothetical protein [Pacificibacter]MBU2936765.1 hypothetical protein [Pacificibacter marinus]MDO6614757.1 hypothetical protein [Pacificibacter sp. 1_MG-2023]